MPEKLFSELIPKTKLKTNGRNIQDSEIDRDARKGI